MEVRCASCNKLFRVSDDKITGSGIKFKCTRCSDTVKITREDFEQYKLSKLAAPDLAFVGRESAKTGPASPGPEQARRSEPVASAHVHDFDLGEEDAPIHREQTAPPAFVKPASASGQPLKPASAKLVEPRPAPAVQAKAEVKIQPQPKPAPLTAPAAPVPPAAPASAHKETARPVSLVMDAAPVRSGSGAGKKMAILFAVLLVMGAAGLGLRSYLEKGAGLGLRSYLEKGFGFWDVSDTAKEMTLPDGLQILNAAGAIDPVKGDLIVTGTIENTTDKPKPAWFVVIDVYDAQGTVLAKGKLLSGKQLYTRRDFEILAKRGMNIQELKQKSLQEQGISIPAKGSVNFEASIMEPPVGIASFNATLQPFDPVQLFKEMAEEQE